MSMASRAEKDRQKQIQDKCQALLTEMLRDEDNKYCVDCDAKGPRWASWNLGIFLCIRCAGIHRNLGVHISKVKSVNLDSWTPEQVVTLQQMGNSRARAVYEANLPDSFRRPQTDSALEAFVRAKYEQKKYIAREWVPPTTPKVNWDKELDEEAERQKKRKKDAKQQQTRKSNNSLAEITVPQLLPKPKGSTSPKPSRTVGDSNRTTAKSATQDLLGLDTPVSGMAGDVAGTANGDDIFSGFLSASPASESCAGNTANDKKEGGDTHKGRSAEEESFFNQPAPSAQEKRQLSKDSILALYSAAPPQPQPVTAPMFGIPGGVYTQPQGTFPPVVAPNMGFGVPSAVMGSQPIHGAVMQNGLFGATGMPPQTAVNVVQGLASNPFFNMAAAPTATAAPAGFPQMAQEHVPCNPNQDLMLDFGLPVSSTRSTIPQQLPQQMARMNLGGAMMPPQPQGMMGLQGQAQPMGMGIGIPQTMPTATPTPLGLGTFQQAPNPGHTLATNLWQ